MQVRPLEKVTQLNSRDAFISTTVMVLILLSIALACAAFVQNDGLSEDNDFLAIEAWAAIWTITFISLWLVSNLASKFLILIVVAEYLRSHIGEKRFSDRTIESNKLFLISDSLMTAAFKAVISFLFPIFFINFICIDQ